MQNYCKQGRHHSFGRGEANLTVSVVIYIKLFLGEQLTMSGVIQHFSRHINKFNCDITRNFKPFSKVLYRHRVILKYILSLKKLRIRHLPKAIFLLAPLSYTAFQMEK